MSEDDKILGEFKTMLFNYAKKITEGKATSDIDVDTTQLDLLDEKFSAIEQKLEEIHTLF